MFKQISLMAGLATSCASCGTYVPDQNEFYESRAQGAVNNVLIVKNITCEARNAIYDLISRDFERVRVGEISKRQTKWLDDWGVQLTLNLTVNESGGIAPSLNALPFSSAGFIFSLAANGAASAESTRIDKMHAYYSVRELAASRCPDVDRPGGPFLMQSDLKLAAWLSDNIANQTIGFVDYPADTSGPFKQDVISHEVQFVVTTSGSITPTWKLENVTVNPAGDFLSSSRVRTHNLLLTLGPMDKVALAKGIKTPSIAAINSNLASDIGTEFRNALRTGRLVGLR